MITTTNKITKALEKILKVDTSTRFQMNSICKHGKIIFITDGCVMVHGDEIVKFLPNHKINEDGVDNVRVPDANSVIPKKATEICFTWNPLSRIKDASIAISKEGKIVAIRPDKNADLWIGPYDKENDIIINSTYLDIAYNLGIYKFYWSSDNKSCIVGTSKQTHLSMVITPINVIT